MMTRLLAACLTLLVAGFAFSVERAEAAFRCAAQPATNIRVILTTNPIKYDNSQSERQLKGHHIDTVNPYGTQAETEVGGLMSGGVQLKSNIQLAWETDRISSCYWYKTIDVVMNIDPTVYIAREHRPGSCRYNAVLEHEMKHVLTDRIVAKQWRPRIQAYLQQQTARLGVIGPYPANQQAAVRTKMTAFMQKALEIASAPMHEDRKLRQQAIDTRDEYERVNRLCR
jgi:hypothetical protein